MIFDSHKILLFALLLGMSEKIKKSVYKKNNLKLSFKSLYVLINVL